MGNTVNLKSGKKVSIVGSGSPYSFQQVYLVQCQIFV